MNNCLICDKKFNSALALAGHKRMHGKSAGKIIRILCCCIFTKKEIAVQFLEKYQKNLTSCKQCGNIFKPNKNKLYFCCHSCSASYNNIARGSRSNQTKKNISFGLSEYYKLNPRKKSIKLPFKKPPKLEILGEYSKLFCCSCRHCKTTFLSRIRKQYCIAHKHLYSASNKAGYKFTFNVFHYPDLFDLELLKSVGWFSPGGKSGKWNINGISRDHKVSVTDSIANNYDPFYITHPLNCELMPHTKNNKKKTKSSITYTELILLVDAYNKPK